MKRKLAIVFISLLAIIVVAFYLKEDISYKELSLSDNEINSYSANTPSSENPTLGIEERGSKTIVTIIGQVGQQIEIVSISKSEEVGIDVFYKITKSTDSSSKRPVKMVSFRNLFGKPVGFKEIN